MVSLLAAIATYGLRILKDTTNSQSILNSEETIMSDSIKSVLFGSPKDFSKKLTRLDYLGGSMLVYVVFVITAVVMVSAPIVGFLLLPIIFMSFKLCLSRLKSAFPGWGHAGAVILAFFVITFASGFYPNPDLVLISGIMSFLGSMVLLFAPPQQ